ncbi:hypothetical protein [Streptomyces spinosisporus]|uniref:Uncharacterized protein n=1 Tax=Streptomyces spinosisporus TaxID=2927582 RepID=A0ABS9XZN4_9ACTN|nr:hypothetical protein [Streptomyces spinosisporus]MCI3246327.1 hypothetical protein [Streptomyces spinosisporus]
MLTLTKDAVTLYDIQTNTTWEQMSHRDAERDLAACRRLGDTLQEYDTTDRAGNPLRVILQIGANDYYSGPDMGGVYEFTR